MDSMIYENEEEHVKGWGIIAHNFIVSEGDQKRVRFFIKAMQGNQEFFDTYGF